MEPGEFEGRIGRYHWESEAVVAARAARRRTGAPNVLRRGARRRRASPSSAASAPTSPRRTSTRLAAGGLRYANFHTTALCSPTRACVLTGRNHHTVRHGPHRRPGHRASPATTPASRASCALLPGDAHARTATPPTPSASGTSRPRTRSTSAPAATAGRSGAGFERFYGFFAGETHQFVPGADPRQPPRRAAGAAYEDGYHLTEDLVDHAIEYVEDLRNVDVDKPWLLYLATGACHSPHQAPRRVDRALPRPLRRRLGRVAGGDAAPARRQPGCCPTHTELSPRPDWVPAWDDLDRRRAARLRPLHGGLRRLPVPHRRTSSAGCSTGSSAIGELDNTLVHGAVRQRRVVGGRPDRLAQRRPGVERAAAHASRRPPSGSTRSAGPASTTTTRGAGRSPATRPFRRWKRETHEGGVADPLIVHWPAGIARARRGARTSTCTPSTSLPTILDADRHRAAGRASAASTQRPLDGTSASRYTFDDADAPERHTVQYYEMFGCRALYHDGWKAVDLPRRSRPTSPASTTAAWELYDLRADPSECHDLAAAEPERLAAMVERWWEEAERHQVLPLDNRPFSELVFEPAAVGARRARGTRTGPAGRRCPRAWR